MERGRCALAAGPLSPDMQPGHIRTDPLGLPVLREGGRGKVSGENKSTKVDDGMFEESKEESHMVVKGCGGGGTIMAVSWGSPPNTHFGLSHHQEESQTQTASPPKVLQPPSPRTVKAAHWPVKCSKGNLALR